MGSMLMFMLIGVGKGNNDGNNGYGNGSYYEYGNNGRTTANVVV
jgi:hypothetical protein